MKRIALYIILFSYTTVMLKPVSPYISDVVAHIFNYTQHMATVHYKNGNFHVHREVMDNAKKTGSQKELPSLKKENTANDHISVTQVKLVHSPTINTGHSFIQASPLLQNCLSADYPPPRA